jgi:AGCS family alanine or glycine:cation symporter
MGFINLRGFKHAIQVTRGVYDNPDDPGEISHFQALTSALSATVGLGNIAGVAVAVGKGGPGAVFWMVLIAFFGMTAKFVECTLAQMYRRIDDDGTVHGGPMYYLSVGLKKKGMGMFGSFLSILFAVCIIGGAFGGGNMFQANQSYELAATQVPIFESHSWLYGTLLAVLVALVILGGIKRIGAATAKIVPAMAGIYIVTCLYIILSNLGEIPGVFEEIFSQAFQGDALFGGVIGALIVGMTRAVFSNEAGVGSAAIAHSAAKTDEPVREGMVAMLGPFIDTIVICLMTASVILITNPPELRHMLAAKQNQQTLSAQLAKVDEAKNPAAHAYLSTRLKKANIVYGGSKLMPKDAMLDLLEMDSDAKLHAAIKDGRVETSSDKDGVPVYKVPKKERGAAITSGAFQEVFTWFPIVLSIVVFLFAYSTMISWCYYGEQGWIFLFGGKTLVIYRLMFLGAVVLGSMANLGAVIDFSDTMIFLCAFPNIIGGVILSVDVRKRLAEYWKRHKSGSFVRYK